MTSPIVSTPKRRWWRMRRLWLLAAFLSCIALAPLAVPVYQSWHIDRQLAAIVAESDRFDPGWRYEEMLAKRAVVPDSENAYFQFKKLRERLPKGYDPMYSVLVLPEGIEAGSIEHQSWIWDIQASIEDVPPEVQLNVQQIEALKSDRTKPHPQWILICGKMKQHRIIFQHCVHADISLSSLKAANLRVDFREWVDWLNLKQL